MKFIVDGVANSTPSDTVARAKSENRQANVRAELSAARCRRARGTDHASYATRLVRLAFLAPDIVTAILAGKQPAGLTANKLMADTRLPLDWRDQRAALGFT
jgi:hypothetical protein